LHAGGTIPMMRRNQTSYFFGHEGLWIKRLGGRRQPCVFEFLNEVMHQVFPSRSQQDPALRQSKFHRKCTLSDAVMLAWLPLVQVQVYLARKHKFHSECS